MDHIDNLPNDYDIAYLDYYYGSSGGDIYINKYWNKNKLDEIKCTSAYMLSKKGIQKLLKNAYEIEMQIDSYLTIYAVINKDFNRYIANKNIFNQKVF